MTAAFVRLLDVFIRRLQSVLSGPGLNEASFKLLESVIRHLKGILSSCDEWVRTQKKA